jgi:hypothetical protein
MVEQYAVKQRHGGGKNQQPVPRRDTDNPGANLTLVKV